MALFFNLLSQLKYIHHIKQLFLHHYYILVGWYWFIGFTRGIRNGSLGTSLRLPHSTSHPGNTGKEFIYIGISYTDPELKSTISVQSITHKIHSLLKSGQEVRISYYVMKNSFTFTNRSPKLHKDLLHYARYCHLWWDLMFLSII